MSQPVAVGVGLSSAATAEEVAALLDAVLGELRLARSAVAVIGTRERFAADQRLRLGPPVLGIDDGALVEHSAPVTGRPGLPAKVAEAAAVLAAGGHLLVGTRRSAHATVAVATAPYPVVRRNR